MKKIRLLLVILAVVLLLGAFPVFPAFAQDETPVVTEEPTVVIEPTAAPEPTVAPTQPPVNLPPDVVVTNSSQLLLYLLLAALGGGGLLTILYRFLERREARDLGEKLYQGASPEQQEFLKDVVNGYRDLSARLLDYFEAITDGKPNDTGS